MTDPYFRVTPLSRTRQPRVQCRLEDVERWEATGDD